MVVPNLRFHEYEETWQPHKLGPLTIKIGSGVTPRGGSEVYTDSGVLFIRSQNVNNNKLDLSDPTYIPHSVHAEMKGSIVRAKDILLNITGASIGRSCVVPLVVSEANVNQHVCIIRLSSGNDERFIQQYLSSWRGQKLIYQNQAGGGREGLNFENIRSFILNIPSLPEQQKIADFLSIVDKKIQLLQRKKELLEQYKKGVMQKLFSQEIRFKREDGSDYPEWEKVSIGSMFEYIKTNSFSRNDLNYEKGKYLNIHYGDIHTSFKLRFDVDSERVPHINETADTRYVKQEHYCREGDVVIADASEDYADIGKAIEIIDTRRQSILAGLHTIHCRDVSGNTALGFKGYLLQSEAVRSQIMRIAQGISVLGISKSNLSKIEVSLPCIKEQQKIVTILGNIDNKLESIEMALLRFSEFKKGLLQQMFV